MTEPRRQAYDRKETYPVDEVLPFIVNGKRDDGYKRDYDGDLIKMDSQRYHVFAKSLECAAEGCNLVGSFFAKERSLNKNGNPSGPTFHFNLYAVNEHGDEVLMTKDHIVPKSKGGPNTLVNYQTMCTDCNRTKSDKLE